MPMASSTFLARVPRRERPASCGRRGFFWVLFAGVPQSPSAWLPASAPLVPSSSDPRPSGSAAGPRSAAGSSDSALVLHGAAASTRVLTDAESAKGQPGDVDRQVLRTAGDQAGQRLTQFGSRGEVSLTRQRNHRAAFTSGYGASERTHGSLLTTRHQRATISIRGELSLSRPGPASRATGHDVLAASPPRSRRAPWWRDRRNRCSCPGHQAPKRSCDRPRRAR